MDRKTCWPLILFLSVAGSISLLGYMHLKNGLANKLTNEIEFVEAAVREVQQGLENYDLAVQHTQTQIENADKEVQELQDENGHLSSAYDEKKNQVKACKESLDGLNNEIAAVEKDKSDTDGLFTDEKTKWNEGIDGLKQKLQDVSPVCAHVKIHPEETDPTIKELCPQNQNKTDIALPVSQ